MVPTAGRIRSPPASDAQSLRSSGNSDPCLRTSVGSSGSAGAEWLAPSGWTISAASGKRTRSFWPNRAARADADGGWFVIGWDKGGNPFGIHLKSGKILVEDHDFGGIHEMASSFEAFLEQGLLQ